MNPIESAIALAVRAHTRQMDEDGFPHIVHCFEVFHRCQAVLEEHELRGYSLAKYTHEEILTAALQRAEICSNDPICADHEPDGHTGDRATHGAACHSCLLVAETSCEARNLFLDRALLVGTMSGRDTAFFSKT